MLIHLTPSYFLQYCNVSVELIDVSVPELGLVLENGKDVTVRFQISDCPLNPKQE